MNEHIKDMAKIAEDVIDLQFKNGCPHSPCPYLERSVGCDTCVTLNALYNEGYRKQSEGEWIWTESGEADYEQYWVCSACKEHDFVKTKYCPNCGAKMKGGES